MGSGDVNDFLTHLAVDRQVAASTRNQALSALLFLFTKVLDFTLEIQAVRAKRPERLPVVLSVDEVRRVLAEIPLGPSWLMAGLMYGAGLRAMESCRLRVKDLDFDRQYPEMNVTLTTVGRLMARSIRHAGQAVAMIPGVLDQVVVGLGTRDLRARRSLRLCAFA